MLYYGGLTFYPPDPAHFLKIPNLVAANRIAEAVLERYGLRGSLKSALENLDIDGNIQPVLKCYKNLMVQRDVGHNDFKKDEQFIATAFLTSPKPLSSPFRGVQNN